MLEGRSMYIWHLSQALGNTGVDGLLQKAKAHMLSSLWIKIADGDSEFENVVPPLRERMMELAGKAHAEHITVYGYHVPHCRNAAAVTSEVQKISRLLQDLSLDGVVIDNEEGARYFRGGAEEATAYARGLRQALAPAGRHMVMSSHDVVSAHPNAFAKEIGAHITANGPQVYYGQSSSVQSRLNRAITENAQFSVPFVPVGALFIREPGADDGGCANEDECERRARDFITLVSEHHRADQVKFPGYGFWNWEEAPPKAWDLLKTVPLFV